MWKELGIGHDGEQIHSDGPKGVLGTSEFVIKGAGREVQLRWPVKGLSSTSIESNKFSEIWVVRNLITGDQTRGETTIASKRGHRVSEGTSARHRRRTKGRSRLP